MKKLISLILLCLVTFGCKGKVGDIGPTGPQGTPGDGITSFNKEFRSGVEPSSSYSGHSMNRVDAFATAQVKQNAGEIYIDTSASNVSRLLIRFSLSGWIPANATISGALLELVTATTTSLAVSGDIGIYNMSIPAMVDTGSCIWVPASTTWSHYSGSTWSNCAGPGPITPVFNYDATPMDTVSVTTALNSTNTRLAWNITPSVVQKWLTEPAKNNGVLLAAINEGTQTTGSVRFQTALDGVDVRPNLIVTYYIP